VLLLLLLLLLLLFWGWMDGSLGLVHQRTTTATTAEQRPAN
jgi:hypothetical protein